MITPKQFILKVKLRLWGELVAFSRNKWFYLYLYRSFWHYRFTKDKNSANTSCYYAARPNPGAGIGHQMANWIAGYWFAKQFGLEFAHIPFSNQKWEDFLGFGNNELKVSELVKKGYKVRKLPLFDENNLQEVTCAKAIIQSYSGKNMVLIAEQDQYYSNQYGVMDDIKQKFYHAEARQNDRLIYSTDNFNIAIHVRRGDIVAGAKVGDAGMLFRWQSNEYFVNVLSGVLKILKNDRHAVIHLFSQGKQEDFREFDQFENILYHLDMNPYDTFLHFVRADLLITSKSSFSYKPALMNDGIKICPRDFWHGYPPNDAKWILADNDGKFDKKSLQLLINAF